ncbi:unnamed protein product [Durusdinium trenchii]|uniref:CSC1/OSCA1-like 7TM region domain-containing protein n=1 Tax=Durusdinium trenchii TaxID=1381693 RepID=A0ABP0NHY2_9DINO
MTYLFLLLPLLRYVHGIRLEGNESTVDLRLGSAPEEHLQGNGTNGTKDGLNSVENLLLGAMGNKSTSGLVGVKKNADNDLETMRTAAAFNFLSSLVAFILFTVARYFFPAVYCKKELTDTQAHHPASIWHQVLEKPFGIGLLDWAFAVNRFQDEEVLKHASLDALMFLEFLSLGRQLALVWSIVLVGLLCPLHVFLHSVSLTDLNQLLSMTSFNGLILAHLPANEQLILVWAHVFAVWFVVASASRLIYTAQLRFLEQRFIWLKRIPAPRATTLLVEHLPPECRSDLALRFYFVRLFGPEAIVQAYVVRRTDRLRKLFQEHEHCSSQLHLEQVALGDSGTSTSRRTCPCISTVDKEQLRSDLERLKVEISKEQRRVEEAVHQMDLKVCSSAGFVTFSSRRMCMLAVSPQYRADAAQLTVTMPPDPEDVIYEDLAKDPEMQAGGTVTAGVLLLLIFIIWAPMIATFLDKVEPLILSVENDQLRRLLQGVMSTGVLKMFMSFLPTLFMAIIHNVLTLKAGAWAQLKLQDWFFAFQMVFVLLVTTIVGTILNVLEKILAHPGEVVYILADALPGFSDFYINYILLSCFLQVFDLLRTVNLAKYVFYRSRNVEEDEARQLSEPEDQDSDGMGARMAKVALHLVVCTVFASCCPVILLIAWLYFAVGRYTYGFLVIFAETKKPDMGGAFWVKSLRHLFLGLLVYILLMVGLLSRASATREPVLGALGSLLLLGFGYFRFSALSWEALPFEAVADLDLLEQQVSRGSYRQAECGGVGDEVRRESLVAKLLDVDPREQRKSDGTD